MLANIQYRRFEWVVRGTYDPARTAAVFIEGARATGGFGGRVPEFCGSDVPGRPPTYQYLDAIFPKDMFPPSLFPADRWLFDDDEEDTHAFYRARMPGTTRDWGWFSTPLLIVLGDDDVYRFVVEEEYTGTSRSDEWREALRALELFALAAAVESVFVQ
jgi:hypothetical protein